MLEFAYSNPYVISLAVAVCTILAAKIAYFIIDKWVRRLTKKTKTDIDDAIIDVIKGPVYMIVIIAGFYKAVMILPFIAEYQAYVNNISFILAVFGFAWIAQRMISVAVPRWLVVSKSFEKTPRILSRVINGAIYFIALLIILDHLDVSITPLITTLGIGGIAVGLALQDTLSNFFAGLHIVSDKPVNIGDFIEIDGSGSQVTGYVEDIGWRSTKIKTLQENIVIIPNAKLSQSIIINHSLPAPSLWFSVKCGASYQADLEKVEKVALEAANYVKKHVSGVPKKFEPSIRFNEFGESNILFSVNMQAEQFADKFRISSELMKELKRRFDKAKIGISYPVRRVIMEKIV